MRRNKNLLKEMINDACCARFNSTAAGAWNAVANEMEKRGFSDYLYGEASISVIDAWYACDTYSVNSELFVKADAAYKALYRHTQNPVFLYHAAECREAICLSKDRNDHDFDRMIRAWNEAVNAHIGFADTVEQSDPKSFTWANEQIIFIYDRLFECTEVESYRESADSFRKLINKYNLDPVYNPVIRTKQNNPYGGPRLFACSPVPEAAPSELTVSPYLTA